MKFCRSKSVPLLLFLGAALPAMALASGGEMPPLVHDIGFSLLLSGLLAVLFNRFAIPSIAAFLVAGVVAGPIGGHVVTSTENIDTIAQLGLVLLLFVIGLELDLRKVLASGRTIMLSGALQFPLCVAAGFLGALPMVDLGLGGPTVAPGAAGGYAPLYVGFIVAASSTLLVVKLYQESFQIDTLAGRVSLGLLIFQDIWSIIVIAVQPNFDDPQLSPILFSFLGIGIVVLTAALAARYLLPIAFRWIAKVPELLLVAAIGWCFGIVFLGGGLDRVAQALFGAQVHLAVGSGMSALIAGASIASLPYSTDVVGKVGIVKDFFVTLFFVGLGMSIPLPQTAAVLWLALGLSVLVVLARYLVFFPLLYWTGLDRRNAMVTSTRLAQVSEFGLVIAYAGLSLGHITPELSSVIIFAFVLTALLTPLLFRQADLIHELFGPWLSRLGFREPETAQAQDQESYSLALLGFHRIASSLLHEIQRTQPDLTKRLLVVDFNVQLHSAIARLGPRVRYGDLRNPETLHHAGVDKAEVVIITVPDDLLKGTSNRKIVEAVRHINPSARIIASAIELQAAEAVYKAGADYVYLPRVDTAQALMPALSHALEGTLAQYRKEEELREGPWSNRREVLD